MDETTTETLKEEQAGAALYQSPKLRAKFDLFVKEFTFVLLFD